MEEELQQSVILSEEDAEFEEDDAMQDVATLGASVSLNPEPNSNLHPDSTGHAGGDEEDAEEAEETQQSTIDNYTGVSIRVRIASVRVAPFNVLTKDLGFIQLKSR